MAAPAMVFVDTCMWIEFFNRPRSIAKQVIEELIDDDRAVLIANVVVEILLGFRRDEHADWVAASLAGLHVFDVEWDDCRSAARLGRLLARNGHRIPLTDLTLAAVALRTGATVYTIDPHFDLFPSLPRFQP